MFNISDSEEDNSSSDDDEDDDGGQSTSSSCRPAKAKLSKYHQKHSFDSDEDDEERDDGYDDNDKENKLIRSNSHKQQVVTQPKKHQHRDSMHKFVLNKQLSGNNLTAKQLNDPDKPNLSQFSRSSVGGSKYLLTCHPNPQPDIEDLVFESRFESGNLAKAVKITSGYYELYLRPDMYTNRHTQWFYFRVGNTRKNVNYR